VVEQNLRFLQSNSCAAFSIEDDGEEKLVVVAEGTRNMVHWSKTNADANGALLALREDLDALRVTILEKFGVGLSQLTFVRPMSFPRTSSGKVQRQLAKQMLLRKDFEILLESVVGTHMEGETPTAYSNELVRLICQTLCERDHRMRHSLSRIDGRTTFDPYGIDSMAAVDVGLRLGKKARFESRGRIPLSTQY